MATGADPSPGSSTSWETSEGLTLSSGVSPDAILMGDDVLIDDSIVLAPGLSLNLFVHRSCGGLSGKVRLVESSLVEN